MYGKTGFNTKKEYDEARYLRLKKEKKSREIPHPIMKLSEVEKAYIAGLIDGEGAIYCAYYKRHETWYPTISIFMTSEGVLRWLAEKTMAQKVHICRRKNKPGDRYKAIPKTQYLYRISGKYAQLLCKTILPYLRVKDNHAQVVCAFPTQYTKSNNKEKIYLEKKQLAEQLTSLNDNRYKRRHTGKKDR